MQIQYLISFVMNSTFSSFQKTGAIFLSFEFLNNTPIEYKYVKMWTESDQVFSKVKLCLLNVWDDDLGILMKSSLIVKGRMN